MAGADELRIERWSPAYRATVIGLQRHLWSGDVAVNAVYFDWKYLANPFLAEPLVYLAFHGEQPVGMRGAFGSCWESGHGVRQVLPYPDDLVVVPEYRGRWVHQRIMQAALPDLARRGHDWVVNLSASHHTAAASLRMKWRSAGGVGPVVLRSARTRITERLAGCLRRLPGAWRAAALARPASLTRDAAAYKRFERSAAGRGFLAGATPRAAEMAALVARLPADGRLRHVRDAAWLDWRYRNPLHEYRFAWAGNGPLEGYIALRRIRGQARVSIVDLEASDRALRIELLAAAAGARFPEPHAWSSTFDDDTRPSLAALGFVPEGGAYETALLVRATADDRVRGDWRLHGKRVDELASWDLRMIASAAG